MLIAAVALSSVAADPNVVYAGYNHLVAFRGNGKGSVDLFDYHRHLKSDSTCNVFLTPPILRNASIHDKILTQNDDPSAVEIEWLGYESFITEVRLPE